VVVEAVPGEEDGRGASAPEPPVTDGEFPVLYVDGREQAPETTRSARRTVRWPSRRRRDSESARGLGEPARQRLVRGVDAARDLCDLLEGLPVLGSRALLARRVADDVAERLAADTVGLWVPQAKGWVVLAQVGFTSAQTTMVVPDDQPLFSEITRTAGGILIDPVHQVQSAVTGIGGAHTSSFMAAAVAMAGRATGILAAGRSGSFGQDDLDLLLGVADELAPGLAIAEEFERLWVYASEYLPQDRASEGEQKAGEQGFQGDG
jgi:hypothetical protein